MYVHPYMDTIKKKKNARTWFAQRKKTTTRRRLSLQQLEAETSSDGLGGAVVDQALPVLQRDRDGVDGVVAPLRGLLLTLHEAVHHDAEQDEDGYTQDGGYSYDTCSMNENYMLKTKRKNGPYMELYSVL